MPINSFRLGDGFFSNVEHHIQIQHAQYTRLRMPFLRIRTMIATNTVGIRTEKEGESEESWKRIKKNWLIWLCPTLQRERENGNCSKAHDSAVSILSLHDHVQFNLEIDFLWIVYANNSHFDNDRWHCHWQFSGFSCVAMKKVKEWP